MSRVSLLAALVFPVLAFAEDAAALLEKGIYAEETVGDLDRAIETYQRVLDEHAAQRAAAAEAAFRLAMCLKKKGQGEQAASGLEKLIALYPEEKGLVGQARDELAKLRPRTQALPLGEEVRRTVLDEREGLDEKEGRECYLDLDTGRLLGRGSLKGFREVTEWRRTTGVDLAGRASIAGVIGFDMAALKVEPSAWESPPEELLRSLERARGSATVALSGDRGLPATCLFRTREGSVGLLEILRVSTDTPARVEIRYRLLSQGLAGPGRAASLLPQIKASFFLAVKAVKAGDPGAARKAMETVMPSVRELEKLIEGTPASKTIGLAITQLERFDEAVRQGNLDRAAGISEALDAVGSALEEMIAKLGNGAGAAAVKGEQGRVAFRLVATGEDEAAADELVDPADSTGKSPRVRVLREVIADATAVRSAEVREAAGGGWEIALTLSGEGARVLSEASARSIGRRLAIVVDGRLVSAPLVRDRVGREVVISGNFSYGEAALLARAIAPGAGGSSDLKKP